MALFSLIAVFLLSASASAEEPFAWRTVSDGEEEAEVRDRPVLYFFTADWCAPCVEMKHEAFRSPDVAALIREGYVPVEVLDRKTEEGRNLAEVDRVQMRFLVEAFPTIVVARPYRGHGVSEAGMLSAEGMVRFLKEATVELDRLERGAKRHAANR